MAVTDGDAPSGVQLEPWRSVPALAGALNAGSEHPTFTVAAIRNYLAKRQDNGLSQFCRKVGQKLLVSQPGFIFWLECQSDTRDVA